MRSVSLALALCAGAFLIGCGPPPVTPNKFATDVEEPQPTKVERATTCARTIVSDPSNWKNNSALLTELGELAQDLGIAESVEFNNFDTSAQDLIKFGTTWIDKADEATITSLRVELNNITTRTEASLQAVQPPVVSGVDVDIETKRSADKIAQEAERLVFTTIRSLRASQADDFGKLFAKAQAAYRNLRMKLKTVESPAEGDGSKHEGP